MSWCCSRRGSSISQTGGRESCCYCSRRRHAWRRAAGCSHARCRPPPPTLAAPSVSMVPHRAWRAPPECEQHLLGALPRGRRLVLWRHAKPDHRLVRRSGRVCPTVVCGSGHRLGLRRRARLGPVHQPRLSRTPSPSPLLDRHRSPAHGPTVAQTWNAVFIHYCDGASFGSGRTEPFTLRRHGSPSEGKLWMRGRNNFNAVIDDLLSTQGMSRVRW